MGVETCVFVMSTTKCLHTHTLYTHAHTHTTHTRAHARTHTHTHKHARVHTPPYSTGTTRIALTLKQHTSFSDCSSLGRLELFGDASCCFFLGGTGLRGGLLPWLWMNYASLDEVLEALPLRLRPVGFSFGWVKDSRCIIEFEREAISGGLCNVR